MRNRVGKIYNLLLKGGCSEFILDRKNCLIRRNHCSFAGMQKCYREVFGYGRRESWILKSNNEADWVRIRKFVVICGHLQLKLFIRRIIRDNDSKPRKSSFVFLYTTEHWRIIILSHCVLIHPKWENSNRINYRKVYLKVC